MSTPTPPEAEDTPTPEEPVEATETPQPEPEPEGADQLGDAGKRALDRMKAERDEARRLAREHAARVKEFEDRDKSELERATERATSAEERAAKALASAVAARVEALAGRKVGERAAFADPEDAIGALDLTRYADEQGVIDTDAIETDLADLLGRKPHWAAQAAAPSAPKAPKPDPGQGARPGGDPGSLDEQIRAAEQAGDWALSRRLKTQKFGTFNRTT
ncbi:hypothetical protein [Streptomyces harbinensis]|uniref:hypothetical protein n=1 Tax=Streptomyces harbinensis TaxID=1176198 RepID=UPI0036CBE176